METSGEYDRVLTLSMEVERCGIISLIKIHTGFFFYGFNPPNSLCTVQLKKAAIFLYTEIRAAKWFRTFFMVLSAAVERILCLLGLERTPRGLSC
ncbi:hypothetical protein EUGRSUZ_C03999 [Eucalyptus grandis]|uniref:Uncharacterized protein n=2 Tax=Eucalyptus grandis TaxID=71139 RepID=A0ACC3LKU7_EUCGR|nr:hypothetical protein EUGRSUZ_C03999 [Eucalyptus grandis]